MRDGTLVKITDIEGQVTGVVGGVTYQYLTSDEYDNLVGLLSDYSYIGKSFEVEEISNFVIPSLLKECRQGWREIKCEDCQLHCAIPTRDHTSPSTEYCPACRTLCVIHSSWPDENLSVDKFGNLV